MLGRAKPVLVVVIALTAGCGGGRTPLRDAGIARPVWDGGPVKLVDDAGTLFPAVQCPTGTVPRMVELTSAVKLDLLFMIDNSGSMEEEQANLAYNFPRLIDQLKNLPNGFPDLHLGVVSSDMGEGGSWDRVGDGGVLQVRPNCGLDPVSYHYLSAQAGNTGGNFKGDIASVFACLAKLGDGGSGFEHQLEAVRVALSGFVPANDGFLRPDAHLAVVYITDEDDCSAPSDSDLYNLDLPGQDWNLRCQLRGHVCDGARVPAAVFSTPLSHCGAAPDGGGKLIPVQTFIDDMKLLRTQSVSVAVIGGWPDDYDTATYAIGLDTSYGTELTEIPICSSANGVANVGLRLKQFVDAFGPAGTMLSICQSDFSKAMSQIGQLITTTVDSSLVECR